MPPDNAPAWLVGGLQRATRYLLPVVKGCRLIDNPLPCRVGVDLNELKHVAYEQVSANFLVVQLALWEWLIILRLRLPN
jgi:hypothetical protein